MCSSSIVQLLYRSAPLLYNFVQIIYSSSTVQLCTSCLQLLYCATHLWFIYCASHLQPLLYSPSSVQPLYCTNHLMYSSSAAGQIHARQMYCWLNAPNKGNIVVYCIRHTTAQLQLRLPPYTFLFGMFRFNDQSEGQASLWTSGQLQYVNLVVGCGDMG